MLVPVALDYWFVRAFGVNVPFADSWNGTLPVVRSMATGQLNLPLLWAPHNENRMLFPNLILGFADSHSRANAKLDMYLTAAIMTISLIMLVYLARRTTRLHPLLLVPLAFALFDWAQVENLLWAFQLAWMLIVCVLLVALIGLDHRHSPGWFLVACLAGVVGSYSSLQGLLIWPVGLLYAALVGWRLRWLGVWIVVAAATTGLYLWHFVGMGSRSALRYDLHHLPDTLIYLLRLIGTIVPTHHHIAAGLAILLGSLLLGVVALRQKASVGRLRLPICLWTMGFLFDLLVAAGRTQLAVPSSSRYTTFTLLLAEGLYLAAVALLVPSRSFTWSLVAAHLRALKGTEAVCLLVIVVTVATLAASYRGLRQGRAAYTARERSAVVLRDFRTESDAQLAAALFPLGALRPILGNLAFVSALVGVLLTSPGSDPAEDGCQRSQSSVWDLISALGRWRC